MNTPNLKCNVNLTVYTTSLELETFIKEVTGHSCNIVSTLPEFHIGNKVTCYPTGMSVDNAMISFWDSFNETGEQGPLALTDILNMLVYEHKLNAGTYVVSILENETKNSLLSSDAKGILHDACINVCNEIKHSKYSDIHKDMIEAVWEAADKVLRAHTKNKVE